MSADTEANGAQELQKIEDDIGTEFPLPSVRRVAMAGLLTVFVAFGGVAAWAFVTQVERAVIAQGNLIAEGRRKTITLADGGVLRTMLVKDGDRVAAGQVLFRLDTAQAQATAEQARAQYWGGLARIARLKAEQADLRSFTVPPEIEAAAVHTLTLRELIDTERRLFPARWEAFDGATEVQQRQINQLSAQVAGIPRQRQASERQLAAIQERIRGFADLARTGVGSRFRVLELIEPEQSYQSNIAQLTAQEAQLNQSIAQAQAQLAALRLNRQQDIANDMQTAAAQVAQAQQAMRAAEELLARRDVLAPEEGVITNIQLYTPGSSILAGQAVMDLVPGSDRLIVEARVALTDIEQVAVGQRANVRLLPYRARTTPLVGGRVLHVAADQQSDPANGAYFIARLEMDQAELADIPNLILSAGMPTENYIVGEPRSVAAYLLSPLRDAVRRSLRD